MMASNAILSASQYLFMIQRNPASLNTTVEIQPSLLLTLPAPASGIVLQFDPTVLLRELAHNRKPLELHFSEEAITTEGSVIPEGAVQMPDLSLFRKRIIQSVFTDFYETQKSRVDTKWNGLLNWHGTWQFAWLVRNALAHGGKINWIDQRVSSVTWKTITYNYTNHNNREIIFKEIAEGDLIILIDEIDKALI